MRLQLIDLKNLPKTSILDGTPIYANPVRWIRKFFLQRIELCLNLLKTQNGNTLDAGCGSGLLLPTLSNVNGMIVGLDIHKYLYKTKNYLKKNKFKNIHLIQADTHYLPFKDQVFNSILVISTLDHLKEPKLAVNQLHRIVKLNGITIFGFHVSSVFSSLIIFVWGIIFLISYSLIFRNFKEILHALFKPSSWRHSHSDSTLQHWIGNRFAIERREYLPSIWPVYVAISSRKEKIE